MGGATAHNPEYTVGGIDKEHLPLFVDKAIFVVGEEVADKLCAFRHAEGLKTVGMTPVAQSEGELEGIGVEKGLVGRQVAEVDGAGVRLKGFAMERHRGFDRGGRKRIEQQEVAVEERRVGWRLEAAARGVALGNVRNGGSIEPVGAQQLEKKLGALSRGWIGQEAVKAIETEADADGAVRQRLYQPMTEGLKQGSKELLHALQVCYGVGQSSIRRRLELSQQGQQGVANLVAPIDERGIGDILDMVETIAACVVLNLGAPKGEQRTHYKSLNGQDAVETGETGAAKKVDEKGLRRVVAVVGSKYGRVAMRLAEGAEPVVTEVSCRLLDAETMGGSMSEGVELGDVEGDLIAVGKGTDKGFVAVAVDGA